MEDQDHLLVLDRVRDELHDLGYVGGLLREKYDFADFLAPDYAVKQIPLAAFTQEPPSYRHASFGVAVANGVVGPELIQGYRSLGAPQIFEINGDQVVRWKVTGTGAPARLDEVSADQVSALFADHKNDWAPRSVLRAQSGDPTATQLDFFDLGLLPLLDYEVRTKLDHLLSEIVNLATTASGQEHPFEDDQYPPLFRLIFRLLAAKVLADRQHPGDWAPEDPRAAIAAVEEFYFSSDTPEPVLADHDTQLAIWRHLNSRLHFQNLSVDSLAYVYENTLVSPATRKSFGIHGTPREVAEYVVSRLPFEDLEQGSRRVFEPFSGHSVFLVAAMQRLRELLPPTMSSEARHQYFVDMLSGIEVDSFAREVAKLSLMLADYPNPDGWRLFDGDAFAAPRFDQELEAASVVLCNPPFEQFTSDEKALYPGIERTTKPAEMLRRVLQRPPKLLGLVLPRSFLTGRGYRDLRVQIGNNYSSVEVLELPDRIFRHSDAETVLLTASGAPGGSVHVRAAGVTDRRDFYATRQASYSSEADIPDPAAAFAEHMGLLRLPEVWEATASMQRLADVASIHRGIQYNKHFSGHEAELVATEPRADFAPGVRGTRGSAEPFVVTGQVFLNVAPERMLTSASRFPWEEPKVIVNTSRRSRGPWVMSAAVDESGLVCYQNLHGVWLDGTIPLEVGAAVLNGPVANAFIAVREGKRHVRVQTLRGVPVPDFDEAQQERVVSLVREYAQTRGAWLAQEVDEREAHDQCLQLLLEIDAEVLRAYDLPLRVEHDLLDYFHGHNRAGPVDFNHYIPLGFRPHFPLHMHVSGVIAKARASETLKRLPSIPQSPLIDEALSYID